MDNTQMLSAKGLRNEIAKQYGEHGAYTQIFDKIYSVYLQNLPSHIDNRTVKCTCGNPNCKTGLNFDLLDGNNTCILLTDRNGNEHHMHTTLETINQIAENLNIITQ